MSNEIKKQLAFEITRQFHGEEGAKAAQENFESRDYNNSFPNSNSIHFNIGNGNKDLFDQNQLRHFDEMMDEARKNNLGADILRYLEVELSKKRDELIGKLSIDKDTKDSLEVYVLLIREFIRQFAAHYEYALLTKGN